VGARMNGPIFGLLEFFCGELVILMTIFDRFVFASL
jgi:hypothetical protein